VLAELPGGRAHPFSGPLPGARIAVSGDPHGRMIEVYPDTVVMTPGEGEAPVAYEALCRPCEGPLSGRKVTSTSDPPRTFAKSALGVAARFG
jgi:hypothetical protein